MLQMQWSTEVDIEIQHKKQLLHQVLGWDAELLFQQNPGCNGFLRATRIQNFFHALIRGKRGRNKISLQGVDGNVVKDPRIIGEMAVRHFGESFMASRYHMSEDLFIDYPWNVTA